MKSKQFALGNIIIFIFTQNFGQTVIHNNFKKLQIDYDKKGILVLWVCVKQYSDIFTDLDNYLKGKVYLYSANALLNVEGRNYNIDQAARLVLKFGHSWPKIL